jgi:hypothetical protein
MKLNNFIEKLQNIANEKGGNIEVIMADNIPIVNPKISNEYPKSGTCVVITDEE